MKANEAPEKIYVPTAGDELHYHTTCSNNEFQESIEYTRTDAFIEKACEFISKRLIVYPRGSFVEDFKNYMKGN